MAREQNRLTQAIDELTMFTEEQMVGVELRGMSPRELVLTVLAGAHIQSMGAESILALLGKMKQPKPE